MKLTQIWRRLIEFDNSKSGIPSLTLLGLGIGLVLGATTSSSWFGLLVSIILPVLCVVIGAIAFFFHGRIVIFTFLMAVFLGTLIGNNII